MHVIVQLVLQTQADLDIGDGNSVDLDKHAGNVEDKCQDGTDCEICLVGSYRAPTGHSQEHHQSKLTTHSKVKR